MVRDEAGHFLVKLIIADSELGGFADAYRYRQPATVGTKLRVDKN
jgi:hypothetical protein